MGVNEIATSNARIIIQNIFKYQIVFSARFDKQDEYGQILNEIKFYINLIKNQSLTESDIDEIDTEIPLEHQIQNHRQKKSGWRFDKINSMTKFFTKLLE